MLVSLLLRPVLPPLYRFDVRLDFLGLLPEDEEFVEELPRAHNAAITLLLRRTHRAAIKLLLLLIIFTFRLDILIAFLQFMLLAKNVNLEHDEPRAREHRPELLHLLRVFLLVYQELLRQDVTESREQRVHNLQTVALKRLFFQQCIVFLQ